MPIIRMRKAAVGYPGHPVLDPLDLDVEGGGFIVLSGPNGSGKTTLLKTCAGLISPLAGVVERGNLRIGYVPQQEDLDLALPITAREVVEIGMMAAQSCWQRLDRANREHAADCLRECRADGFAGRLFHELSGGQRQRTLFARALATRPDTLLLDEPTCGIDAETQQLLIGLLGRLRSENGMTVMVVTHDPQSFQSIATRHGRVQDRVVSWQAR